MVGGVRPLELEVVVLEVVVLAVLQEEVVSAVVIPHQVGVVEVVMYGWAPVIEVLVPQLCGKV